MQSLTDAIALHQSGQLHAARALYEKILHNDSSNINAMHLLGVTYAQTGEFNPALRYLGLAANLAQEDAAIQNNLGNVQRLIGNTDDAIKSFQKAISLKSDYPEAYNNLGNALQDIKEIGKAIESYEKAISLNSDYIEAIYNLGVALQKNHQHESAIKNLLIATEKHPGISKIHTRLATSFAQIGQLTEAKKHSKIGIELDPSDAEAYLVLGNVFNIQNMFSEAIESYNQALNLDPNLSDAYCSRAVSRSKIGLTEEAILDCNKAIEIKPDSALAFKNRAAIKITNDDYLNAEIDIRESLNLNPTDDESLVTFGALLANRHEYSDAISQYHKALDINKKNDDAHFCLGLLYQIKKNPSQALVHFEEAYKIEPNRDYLVGNKIECKLSQCDWSELEDLISEVKQKIQMNLRPAYPLTISCVINDLGILKKASEMLDSSLAPQRNRPFRKIGAKKIRIGYFSADFHAHPVTQLIVRCIELHNRQNFEIVGFSFDASPEDTARRRLIAAFDQFIDVTNYNASDIADLAVEQKIDISVDLMGHTRNSRPDIFSHRAAPIQVAFLGYPGTTGSRSLDYIIADPTVIPSGHQQYYTEKIAYLPDSYLPNDPVEDRHTQVPNKKELGLPDNAFIYCCLNNTSKITPEIFRSWCTILKNVPDSVLWLRAENIETSRNLIKHATQLGISESRLVFAGRTESHAEHLVRYRVADLFLDTSPYNAHTTASDALWNDLPVLTCMGETFSSRVAGSLLKSVGLPELVTNNFMDYENLAINLGKDKNMIESLKEKLRKNRHTHPLFKPDLFTKNLEALFGKMIQQHNNQSPKIDLSL